MKVVTVCLDLSPSHGGMYRGVVDIATMLGAKIVAFRDGTGVAPAKELSVPVEVIEWSEVSLLRQAVWPPAWVVRSAEAAVADADVIVVHSLFRSHAMIVGSIARRMGIPVIVVPHGALDPSLWKSKTLARRMWMACGGNAFLRGAARIVFASQAEQSRALTTLGWRPESAVIPFPVPMIPTTRCQKAARAVMALPEARRLILVLGRLSHGKRPKEIVAAFCEANPRGCDLVIAGPEGDVGLAELRGLVPPAMQRRVWFTGALEPAARDTVLAACDIYLSWSLHESFGYATAEAMASGLPVILSPGNVLQDEPGWPACGIFPKHHDRKALVAALRECANWPDSELFAIGRRGREWVAVHADPVAVALQWHALAESVSDVSGSSRLGQICGIKK